MAKTLEMIVLIMPERRPLLNAKKKDGTPADAMTVIGTGLCDLTPDPRHAFIITHLRLRSELRRLDALTPSTQYKWEHPGNGNGIHL